MAYYEIATEAAREIIRQNFPEAVPDKSQNPKKGEVSKPGYLLWMLKEVSRFDGSMNNAIKAARWLGWIFRDLEIQGLIDNEETKRLFKQDVTEGNDRPALFR